MDKTNFYKEQLSKDSDFYTIEITEIKTQKNGVATLHRDGKQVSCFYGEEDGSDDCIIPFEEFMERFTIDRVIDETNGDYWNVYKVIVNDKDYQLVKE